MTMMTHEQRQKMEYLDWNWGEAYDLAIIPDGWVAKRLDNNRALLSGSPEGLRDLIVVDYTAEPVAREAVS
jgi:hypothetical protein